MKRKPQRRNFDEYSENSHLLLISILLIVLFVWCSCAVSPPDVPLCVEIGPGIGNCVKIVSGESFDVDDAHPFDGKTWWEARPSMIQLPAGSWAKLKAFIIEICKKTNQCDKKISSWDRTIQNVDDQVQKKK